MKHLVLGILAHVDAGKTTLSESIMYLNGCIRKLGRVDHGNAFLDTYELERSRGITIFSKQAVFEMGGTKFTLLDTPGHVDFSAEMERTLQVLDYAILVINGADGIQGHTRTLWNLLKRYEIPTFIFVNKMDQAGTDREKLLDELKQRFDNGCLAFDSQDEEFFENAAMCEEEAMEEFLEQETLSDETLIRMIKNRTIYPCYFGSALKVQGVEAFLEGLKKYAQANENAKMQDEFGAKVYKISRDSQGNRLTHMKITSGTLKVKEMLGEEKINQIRIYSGEKFETAQEVTAGEICAVTGLSNSYPGEGLGKEKASEAPMLEPVLNYQILLPEGCDVHTMLRNLRQLEEEDPMLRIVWKEEIGEIHARLMGEVQIEILKSLIKERFDVDVEFGAGNIVYKETIRNTVEGVGHFEPLRHYAEVHLIMEPGTRGSGITIATECSEDVLDKNWQRLIFTHLLEKTHRGVLTGSALTDVKITLAAGRAHLKHTEGGDFRQSTYRAIRQGLMQAENVLLEPYYEYRLEVPSEMVGRALTDIQRMSGEFNSPETEGDMAVLEGVAPVIEMQDYQREVTSYTRGRGRLSCIFKGYDVCHNPEEVIEAIGYDPEGDTDDPTGSVFCSHGAGFYVPWNQVFGYMHIESQLKKRAAKEREEQEKMQAAENRRKQQIVRTLVNISYDAAAEKELEEIFIRTYGKIERKTSSTENYYTSEEKKRQKKEEKVTEYLLVDGYNIIHAWDDLKELAKINIEAARNKLMDIMCNYQGFKKCVLILVFDAYKVDGYELEIQKYHNIHVVYTKQAETADMYIEKVVHQIGRKYHVRVATSDRVEQVVTLGQGGTLVSAREFQEEVEIVKQQIREEVDKRREHGKNYLFDYMDKKLVDDMEDIRLGRKTIDDVRKQKTVKKQT